MQWILVGFSIFEVLKGVNKQLFSRFTLIILRQIVKLRFKTIPINNYDISHCNLRNLLNLKQFYKIYRNKETFPYQIK